MTYADYGASIVIRSYAVERGVGPESRLFRAQLRNSSVVMRSEMGGKWTDPLEAG